MRGRASVCLILSLVAIVCVLLAVINRRAESGEDSEVGRFQVVVGTYEGSMHEDSGTTTFDVKAFILVDTATGETWHLHEYVSKKKGEDVYKRGWLKTNIDTDR